MSAQGWKPGDYLGAENASHAEHYTGASASHIRALLREDNLGLGAQVGKVNAETFGLSLFSGVLGRLNGKSEAEVQKHQNALRDAELRTYQAQKYGNMNFVSGGFLVGDRIEFSPEGAVPRKGAAFNVSDAENAQEISGQEDPETMEPERKKRKKDKKERKSKADETDDAARSPQAEEQVPETKIRKKERRKSKKDSKVDSTGEEENTAAEDDRSRRKQERRARKEERRRRKEEKRRARSGETSPTGASTPAPQDDLDAEPSSEKPGATATAFAGNRHAVRQRYIQQKRMASLNPQAMKEIFMLKPTVTAA